MVAYDLTAALDLNRAISYGIPAAVIVLVALFLEDFLPSGKAMKVAVELGDASYGMYLFHPFVVLALSRVLFAPILTAELPTIAQIGLTLTALVITAVFSLLLYRFVDRPSQKLLRRFLLDSGTKR